MFIEKLILQGYTRISQNGISRIEIDFTKIMQIILGANGSGKSSIKEQLSVLPPAVSAEFVKGGFKEVHARRNGSLYIAISDYGERNGHYLECDGEILNNWGTAQVQKSLIEQHFGLTQDIFDVICGAKKFTSMSPIDRRDWVMRLSNIDINPLMSKFMESKNRHRDAKAYLNKITERLQIEVKNTVSESNIEELTKQLKELKEEFNYYSKFSEEITATQSDSLEQRASELNDFMDNIMEVYPKVPQWILDKGIRSTDEMTASIVKYETSIDNIAQMLEQNMKELQEINKVAEAKAKLEGVGIDESKLRIANLIERANNANIMLARFGYMRSSDSLLAKNDFVRIFPVLKQQLFELPDNTDYRFNSNSYKEAQGLDYSYNVRLTGIKEQIYKLEHQVKHIDNTDNTQCPKCNYIYKQGVGENDRETLIERINAGNTARVELEKTIADNVAFMTECSAYIEAIRQIYSTMQLTPSNENLWEIIRRMEVFKNSSYPAIEALDKHLEHLEIAVELEEIEALRAKEEDILLKAKQALDIVNNANTENVSKIDERVYQLECQRYEMQDELRKIRHVRDRLLHMELKLDQLRGMFADFNIVYLDTLDNDRAKFIKETKFNIMKEINSVEQELEQAKVKNTIFKDIEKEHEIAVTEVKDYALIMNNLSPNTGLIADIMNDTISNFVNNVNNVISSVWTSDVVMLPCVNKKNDLDWKFPIQVEKGVVRQDASKTSTSQKDIINLSFQLIVLGRSQFPLYLDELGSSMDDQHRINMMHVISDIVESRQCSQLFFISHFAAFHEQFTNNETLVVNTKNILNLPKSYNQHVKIT